MNAGCSNDMKGHFRGRLVAGLVLRTSLSSCCMCTVVKEYLFWLTKGASLQFVNLKQSESS